MLRPWKTRRLLSQGVPLGNIPARRSVITTDASLTGWGAVWEDPSCSGTGWESSSLCPVRALHTYIEHTRPLRQSHKQLFVCFDKKCAGEPVYKQRLSHWIVDTISQAYSSQNLPVPCDLVAHSSRSMATSWAALKGVALSDICAAASWSTPCTFTRFYRINVTNPNSLGSAVLSAVKLPEKGSDNGPS